MAQSRARTGSECDAEHRRLFALLTSTYPDYLLSGRATILAYLTRLGLRTLGGRPIYWKRVQRWVELEGFPLLPGTRSRSPHRRYQATTSLLAVHAWVCSRLHNGARGLFATWDDGVRRPVPSLPGRRITVDHRACLHVQPTGT